MSSQVPAPRDIFRDYPENQFNRLLPAETYFEDIGPMHKVSIDIVRISSNPENKDVYKLKDDQFPLTKRGLAKIADAAGISFHPDFTRVVEHRPKDGYCLFRAVGAMKKADGTFRTLPGHYFIDLEEDRKRGMSDARLKERSKFIVQLCESGAMNRAIRELLAIKSHYKPQELQKPFAVPRINFSPDLSDPDVKRFLLEQAAGASMRLYPPEDAKFHKIPLDKQYQIEHGHTEASSEVDELDTAPEDVVDAGAKRHADQLEAMKVLTFEELKNAFKKAVNAITFDDSGAREVVLRRFRLIHNEPEDNRLHLWADLVLELEALREGGQK